VRSLRQKFVITACENVLAAKAGRLDSVMCRRMAAGCLCWHFLLGEALRLSRMPDCVAGALHLGDNPLLSKLYVGTSENSVHLRQSSIRSPARAQPGAAAQ